MPGRFEADIAAYEREPLPRPGRVVAFYGSSSIHLWADVQACFPEIEIRNRGFGGSTLLECATYFDRLVSPLAPRALVLYAGENDIAEFGAGPADVLVRLLEVTRLIHARLPAIPFAVISIKPSPVRADFLARMERANELVKKALEAMPCATYIDIASAMLDAAGSPRPELFGEDGYHMSPAGYAIWRAALKSWIDHLPA